MPSQSEPRYAGVLAKHRGHLVLVLEEYPRWGAAYWNIPSGRVEDDETPEQGARRELAEETGLVTTPRDLLLVGTSSVTSQGRVSRAWTFAAEVAEPSLEVRDPDGLIQDARWFPVHEAMRLLRSLPYRPLSEPAVSILSGHVPVGGHWAYPDPEEEPLLTFPGGWSGRSSR